MTVFADRIAIHLSVPANLLAVIAPAADTTKARQKALIGAIYDFPFATVHDVVDVQVGRIERSRPLFVPRRRHGTWLQTQPAYERTDVDETERGLMDPLWVDLEVDVTMTLVLEIDAGEVDSILVKHLDTFATLADFAAFFQFIDLPAFMAAEGITNVGELRERYDYLLAEVRLKALQPFNAADPANRHRYSLRLAILIRDPIDVLSGLEAAKQVRAVVEQLTAAPVDPAGGEARTVCAPIVVFPQAGLSGAGVTATQVEAFYAAERVLPLFLTPPP
jgi:hypothetical protein